MELAAKLIAAGRLFVLGNNRAEKKNKHNHNTRI